MRLLIALLILFHTIISIVTSIQTPNIPFTRRRFTDCDTQNDDTAVIELAIVNGPNKVKYFKDTYGNEWQQQITDEIFQIMLELNKIFHNTIWTKDDEEFIHFNIALAAIFNMDSWIIDGKDYTPIVEDKDEYYHAINAFHSYHYKTHGWSFDTMIAIFNKVLPVFGLAPMQLNAYAFIAQPYPGIPPHNPNRIWMLAHYLAHELAHNLGINHDWQCDEGQFDKSILRRRLSTYYTGTFSQCSIDKVYEQYKNGYYESLFKSVIGCNNWINYKGICGNNKIEAYEECDGDKCCDNKCKKITGCCADDEIFECIEANVYDIYDGYYGGCVKSDGSIPGVYVKNNQFENTRNTYLYQAEHLLVSDNKKTCAYSWAVGALFFGNYKSKNAWGFSNSFNEGIIETNVFCEAENNTIDVCNKWKQVECSTYDPNIYEESYYNNPPQLFDAIVQKI
eukprot:59109_1